jgi:hypothetical protein
MSPLIQLLEQTSKQYEIKAVTDNQVNMERFNLSKLNKVEDGGGGSSTVIISVQEFHVPT